MKTQFHTLGKIFKILAFLLSFLLILEQSGFAQVAGQLGIPGQIAAIHSFLVPDAFRPLHLRYLSYDTLNNNFKLLLDKGDQYKGLSRRPQGKGVDPKIELRGIAKHLLDYFYVGLTLPNDTFWVNLRPDDEANIIDNDLAKTDVGRVMLEADLQLKKDTARFTSPETPEGKRYWDKLYKKAEELFGSQNVTIPTLTRVWIVPAEIIISENKTSAYIYKATLRVLLEKDYLKDSKLYNFLNDKEKELNEYSSQLFRESIIPKLTKEVNSSKRYAPLRQVYYSLILAQWFKARFKGLTPQTKGDPEVNTAKASLPAFIDARNLNHLTSQEPWSKTTYFRAYQKSVNEGEYNIHETADTPFSLFHQTTKSYFSGGIIANCDIPTLGGATYTNYDPATNTATYVTSVPVFHPDFVSSNKVFGAEVDASGEVQITTAQVKDSGQVPKEPEKLGEGAGVQAKEKQGIHLNGRHIANVIAAIISSGALMSLTGLQASASDGTATAPTSIISSGAGVFMGAFIVGTFTWLVNKVLRDPSLPLEKKLIISALVLLSNVLVVSAIPVEFVLASLFIPEIYGGFLGFLTAVKGEGLISAFKEAMIKPGIKDFKKQLNKYWSADDKHTLSRIQEVAQDKRIRIIFGKVRPNSKALGWLEDALHRLPRQLMANIRVPVTLRLDDSLRETAGDADISYTAGETRLDVIKGGDDQDYFKEIVLHEIIGHKIAFGSTNGGGKSPLPARAFKKIAKEAGFLGVIFHSQRYIPIDDLPNDYKKLRIFSNDGWVVQKDGRLVTYLDRRLTKEAPKWLRTACKKWNIEIQFADRDTYMLRNPFEAIACVAADYMQDSNRALRGPNREVANILKNTLFVYQQDGQWRYYMFYSNGDRSAVLLTLAEQEAYVQLYGQEPPSKQAQLLVKAKRYYVAPAIAIMLLVGGFLGFSGIENSTPIPSIPVPSPTHIPSSTPTSKGEFPFRMIEPTSTLIPTATPYPQSTIAPTVPPRLIDKNWIQVYKNNRPYVHIVNSGETLWQIAQSYSKNYNMAPQEMMGEIKRLTEQEAQKVMGPSWKLDPNILRPGDVLVLPKPSASAVTSTPVASAPGQIGKRAEVVSVEDNIAKVKDEQGTHDVLLTALSAAEVMEIFLNLQGLSEDVDSVYKELTNAIIKFFEKSPAQFYTFDTLIGDLFGFARPDNRLIALHKSLANNPIALFHEIGEYLVAQGSLTTKLEENILTISINGQPFTLTLEGESLAIAQKGQTNPHYLLRAMQRKVFGKEDTAFTQEIKKQQEPNESVTQGFGTSNGSLLDSLQEGELITVGNNSYRLKKKISSPEHNYIMVFLVEDIQSGKNVVIKVPTNEVAGKDIFSEYEHLSKFKGHPQIVQVVDFYPTGISNLPILVLEYLPGQTLHAFLGNNPSLSLQERLMLIYKIASTIRDVHNAGVVHGDIKPDNIVVLRGKDGQLYLKLLDFHISGNIGDMAKGQTLEWSLPGRIAELEPANDNYSLGLLAQYIMNVKLPTILRGRWYESAGTRVYAHSSLIVSVPTAIRDFFDIFNNVIVRWRRDHNYNYWLSSFLRAKKAELDGKEEEFKDFLNLIRATIAYDPSMRPTAEELAAQAHGLLSSLIMPALLLIDGAQEVALSIGPTLSKYWPTRPLLITGIPAFQQRTVLELIHQEISLKYGEATYIDFDKWVKQDQVERTNRLREILATGNPVFILHYRNNPELLRDFKVLRGHFNDSRLGNTRHLILILGEGDLDYTAYPREEATKTAFPLRNYLTITRYAKGVGLEEYTPNSFGRGVILGVGPAEGIMRFIDYILGKDKIQQIAEKGGLVPMAWKWVKRVVKQEIEPSRISSRSKAKFASALRAAGFDQYYIKSILENISYQQGAATIVRNLINTGALKELAKLAFVLEEVASDPYNIGVILRNISSQQKAAIIAQEFSKLALALKVAQLNLHHTDHIGSILVNISSQEDTATIAKNLINTGAAQEFAKFASAIEVAGFDQYYIESILENISSQQDAATIAQEFARLASALSAAGKNSIIGSILRSISHKTNAATIAQEFARLASALNAAGVAPSSIETILYNISSQQDAATIAQEFARLASALNAAGVHRDDIGFILKSIPSQLHAATIAQGLAKLISALSASGLGQDYIKIILFNIIKPILYNNNFYPKENAATIAQGLAKLALTLNASGLSVNYIGDILDKISYQKEAATIAMNLMDAGAPEQSAGLTSEERFINVFVKYADELSISSIAVDIILTLRKQSPAGTSLSQELSQALKEVSSGRMDISNPLHLLANYLNLRANLEQSPGSEKEVTYASYYEIIQNAQNKTQAQVIEGVPLPEKDMLNMRGAVYEAFLMREKILELQKRAERLGRKIIVVANLSYGGVALAPITEERNGSGTYIVGTDIPVWATKVGSSESHNNEFILVDNLFTPEQLRTLAEDNPFMVVVDGTTSVSDPRRTSAHIPDGFKGYRNFFIALNQALYGQVNPAEFYEDAEFVQGLLNTLSAKKLIQAIQGMNIKPRAPNAYKFRFWYERKADSKKDEFLYLRVGKQKDSPAPKISIPELDSPTCIFMQSAVHPQDIGPAIRRDFIGGKHTPAYFDDKGHFKKFFLAYEEGYGVVPSKRYVYAARKTFLDFMRQQGRELTMRTQTAGLVREVETIALDLDGTLVATDAPLNNGTAGKLNNLLAAGKRVVIITEDIEIHLDSRLRNITKGPGLFIFSDGGTQGYTFDSAGNKSYFADYNARNRIATDIQERILGIILANFQPGSWQQEDRLKRLSVDYRIDLRNVSDRTSFVVRLQQLLDNAGIQAKVYKVGRTSVRVALQHKEHALRFFLETTHADAQKVLIIGDSAHTHGVDRGLLTSLPTGISINVGGFSPTIHRENPNIVQYDNGGPDTTLKLLTNLQLYGGLPENLIVSSSKGQPWDIEEELVPSAALSPGPGTPATGQQLGEDSDVEAYLIGLRNPDPSVVQNVVAILTDKAKEDSKVIAQLQAALLNESDPKVQAMIEEIIAAVLPSNPSASKLPRLPPISAPGGIDLRNLPIVAQSLNNLSASIRNTPANIGKLNSINLDTEWQEIEKLVNSGIIPEAEKLKQYLQASCVKGSMDKDIDKVISCISDILRIEEERYIETEPALKDILIVLESAGSLQELKTAFIGNS